jgi:hypothetical protein
MNNIRLLLIASLFFLGACTSHNSSQNTSIFTPNSIQYNNSYSNVKKRAIFTTPSDEGVTISYDGDFQYGKANGSGEQSYLDGPRITDRYKGQFKDGLRNGYGTYSFGRSGDWYEGNFVAGAMAGTGIYTFGNGNYFVGTFKEGLKDGNGALYAKGGIKLADQIWKAGVLVSSSDKSTVPLQKENIPAPKGGIETQNTMAIKAKKCTNLGLTPGSNDYKLCLEVLNKR